MNTVEIKFDEIKVEDLTTEEIESNNKYHSSYEVLGKVSLVFSCPLPMFEGNKFYLANFIGPQHNNIPDDAIEDMKRMMLLTLLRKLNKEKIEQFAIAAALGGMQVVLPDIDKYKVSIRTFIQIKGNMPKAEVTSQPDNGLYKVG